MFNALGDVIFILSPYSPTIVAFYFIRADPLRIRVTALTGQCYAAVLRKLITPGVGVFRWDAPHPVKIRISKYITHVYVLNNIQWDKHNDRAVLRQHLLDL